MENRERLGSKTRVEALRELRKFHHWVGERRDGEWVREAVATDVKRTFECYGKNRKGETVRVTKEELVYVHDGYRPHFEGEKKPRRAFFHRGARVWRD